MRTTSLALLCLAALAVSLVAPFGRALATPFDVTIDTTSLAGSPAVLVFDFIDGGPPSNTVTLGALTSNGTQGSTSTTGNVTGSGPWALSDAGPSFFNELQVPFNPMGSSLSFSFTTTDNAPALGSIPDAFSFFIFGADLITPLITTNDPTGADALFLFDLGEGAQGLSVYTVAQSDFSIRVAPSQGAPEPGALALFVVGVVALWLRLHKSNAMPWGRRVL